MLQNIKVDIIYYSIGTDFEMEFNLGGCCRMRLLTDTAENRTDFTKCLARSVARSSIIICCGPLFGEKGIIHTLAMATGIETETIETEKYGINSKNQIDIIKNSTPLVSSGTFGGCIVESGQQTIIILSEDKSLRKRLMKELIHPYITQMSMIDSEVRDSELNSDNVDKDAFFENINKSSENATDSQETSDEPTKISLSNEFLVDDGDENATIEPESEIPVLPSNDDVSMFVDISEPRSAFSVHEANSRYYLEDFPELAPEAEETFRLNLAIKIVLLLMIVVFLVALFFAVIRPIYLGNDVGTYIKSIFTPVSERFLGSISNVSEVY